MNSLNNPFEEINSRILEILERLNNISAKPPPNSIEIITQDELSKRLMISKPTLIRWVRKKKIPLIRIGKSVRYNWQAVIEALESPKSKN
jgi:excisionase family DNA binding protein